MNNIDLMNLAEDARKKAYAPISNFKVGAAILTSNGNVYTGCNIEDTSGIGVTNICAERFACMKAIEDMNTKIVKIAVTGGIDLEEKTLPCGVCRQYLIKYGSDIVILYKENNNIMETTLGELLPNAFLNEF